MIHRDLLPAYVRYVKDHIRGDIEDSLYSFIHQNCLDMASVGGSFKNLREKIYRAAFLYAFFRTTDEVVSSFSAEMCFSYSIHHCEKYL